MRVLGIDQAHSCSVGVVERAGSRLLPLHYGVITTEPSMAMPDRLTVLYRGLTDLIREVSTGSGRGRRIIFQ